jgi:hypothetical protein
MGCRELQPLPLFTESRQEICDLEGTHDSARDLMPLGSLGPGAETHLAFLQSEGAGWRRGLCRAGDWAGDRQLRLPELTALMHVLSLLQGGSFLH